jgi:hypothetical protein
MLKYLESVKILHIEPTNLCQAACPQCLRETDLLFDKHDHKSLTVDALQKIIPKEIIARLNKILLCGVYGDPAAGNSLEIFQYVRQINPSIVLGMNSNGGLQSKKWWASLGELVCQQQDYVVFSIDGLEDTNHLYRKNVVWKRVLENVESFISAGGNAHWDMLIYKHNEHQVAECEQLARKLGFKWFRAKVSRRAPVEGLEFPVNWIPPSVNQGEIKCQALLEKSLYIDCDGRIRPCCYLGGNEHKNIVFDDVIPTWSTLPHPVCKSSCSVNNSYRDQWQREIEIC